MKKRVLSLFLAITLFVVILSMNVGTYATGMPLQSPNTSTNVVVNQNPTTFCNPINIGYQYQAEYNSRESADPSVIVFKGEYYLFASHGSGYWWSTNMVDWNFVYITNSDLAEIGNFAPAVCVIGDAIYMTFSSSSSIYKSTNPKSGAWTKVSDTIWWLDPALFVDDDGRVYCYYGGSPTEPLYVVELNAATMKAIGEPVATNLAYPDKHGFEVSGDENTNYNDECWLEGSWMTKHNGKYYLQYAVPGTQYSSYANGYYVSDSPMGPFVFAENSPVSYKSTGFMRGAGHGSTVQDLYGDYWKFDTMSISVNHPFERRLNMYPALFDKYGQMVTNMVFSDYPMYYPSESFSFEKPGPDWNLLSYGKTTTASTSYSSFVPAKAFDENMKTWWSATSGNIGEWLKVDLGKLCDVRALQINFADQDANASLANGRNNSFVYRYFIEFSQDGQTWYPFINRSNAVASPFTDGDKTHDYYELESAIGARYFRITNKGQVPANGKFAISGLRIFGNGNGVIPPEVTNFTAKRAAGNGRSVDINWTAAVGAEGYIIRYGNKTDSKYIHYQVINGNKATINNLNMDVDYYFSIDSYNDSGYTKGTKTLKAIDGDTACLTPYGDEFDGNTLNSEWKWANSSSTNYNVADGHLNFNAYIAGQNGTQNILYKPIKGDFEAVTRFKIAVANPTFGQKVGFRIYKDWSNQTEFMLEGNNGNFLANATNNTYGFPTVKPDADGYYYLKIVKSGNNYSFYYSSDGRTFIKHFERTLLYSPVSIALYAQTGNSATNFTASFDYLKIYKESIFESTDPKNNQTDFPANSSLTLNFLEDVDFTTLNTTNITIDNGAVISQIMTNTQNKKQAVIKFSGLLTTDTNYTLAIKNVKTVSSVILDENFLHFTTASTISIILGDVNSDGNIDVRDYAKLIHYYKTDNADCDLNDDGIVNMLDLSILISNFGSYVY